MDDTAQRLADGEACLKAALEYLAMGWSVLALCPPDHVGVGRVASHHVKDCPSAGKRPWHSWKEYQDRLPTPDEVRGWWSRLPNSNVGLALGPVSGLVRVDVDGPGGEAALREKARGDLPRTLEFRSGRADGTGRGFLYKIPAGIVLRTTYDSHATKNELRFQAKGAQTVLPPSRHKDGGCYEWVDGNSPQYVEAALTPDWVLAELTADRSKSERNGSASWEDILEGVEEGGRNDSAASFVGGLLLDFKNLSDPMTVRRAWAATVGWNTLNRPPLEESELKVVFRSILKREQARRFDEDQGRLDRFITQQVSASVNGEEHKVETNGGVNEVRKPINGETVEPPPWHLVIVESDPPEFRLRSPFWSASPRLQPFNGYLRLTSTQLRHWGGEKSVTTAAFDQAEEVTPKKLTDWDKPGGILARLMKAAERIERSPEAKRRLLVLGWIYRYLSKARDVKIGTDGKPKYSSMGFPTRKNHGTVIFKLEHLKKAVRDAKEDFGAHELTSIIEDEGFCQDRPDGTRWWKASKAIIEKIGHETLEISNGEDIVFDEAIAENDSEAG